MTKRTRYFLFGSATIVVVGLCTGLVAYYGTDLQIFKARVGPEELSYVPADAAGVGYANVREIMDSQFRQKIRATMPDSGQANDKFFQETGIDVERDINSVVAASEVPEAGSTPGQNGIALVRGQFDEGRIEALIREHDGQVEQYKNQRLLLIAGGPGGSDHQAALVFLEPGLAALGAPAMLKKAIDAHADGANITGNAQMMKLIGGVEGSTTSAWAVGGLDAIEQSAKLPAEVKDRLPGVQWVSVRAHVNGGVSGVISAEARDQKAADDLRAVVNGGLAAARLMGGSDQKLGTLVNSFQVSGTGTQVDLSFTLPTEVLSDIQNNPQLRQLAR